MGTEGIVLAGSGNQTHSSSRWGDYSMLAVDPVDGSTFWFTGEYYDTATRRVDDVVPDLRRHLDARGFEDTEIRKLPGYDWSRPPGRELAPRFSRTRVLESAPLRRTMSLAPGTELAHFEIVDPIARIRILRRPLRDRAWPSDVDVDVDVAVVGRASHRWATLSDRVRPLRLRDAVVRARTSIRVDHGDQTAMHEDVEPI